MRNLALALVSSVGFTVCGFAAMADDAPAAPAATAPAAATPAPAASSDADKMVCRNMAPATGSRLGARRECRTQREWDDIRIQSQKETNHMEGSTLGPRGN